jgi:hypothetical protein
MSKSAETEKNRKPIEPRPCARHGAGPSRVKSRLMVNRPTPNALSETSPEVCALYRNGSRLISPSSVRFPSTRNPLNPSST